MHFVRQSNFPEFLPFFTCAIFFLSSKLNQGATFPHACSVDGHVETCTFVTTVCIKKNNLIAHLFYLYMQEICMHLIYLCCLRSVSLPCLENCQTCMKLIQGLWSAPSLTHPHAF